MTGLAVLAAVFIGYSLIAVRLERTSITALRDAGGFTEDTALFASFLVWAIFGALLVAPLLTHEFHPSVIAYAVLSLTLLRIVPVALAMAGTGLRPAPVRVVTAAR